MKKHNFVAFIAVILLVVTHDLFGQKVTLDGLLESAISLSKNGETEKLADVLKSGSFALESEANTRGNDFKGKLLGQAEALKSLIPLATEGTLKTDVLSKVVNTIRLLVGANQINNLLSGGKDALLGNAESLGGSIALLHAGKEALSGKEQGKLDDLLGLVSGTVKKLDGQDSAAKLAASSSKRTLGKIVDLVKNAL